MLHILGYDATLVIDLDGEPHDISRLLRLDDGQWVLDAGEVASEIAIEVRARERALSRRTVV